MSSKQRWMVAALASLSLAAATLSTSGGVAAQGATVAKYVLTPNSIAAPGALAAGQVVDVTVTAEDAQGSSIPGATVYLSFLPALGAGGTAEVGSTVLTASPEAFTTDAKGEVAIVYTAPNPIPPYSVHCQTSGSFGHCDTSDGITVANAATAPSVTMGDFYTYVDITGFPVSSAGGTLATSDDTFSAAVPEGAVPRGYQLEVAHTQLGTGNWHSWGLPSSQLQVDEAFDLSTVPSGGSISQGVAATIQYQGADLVNASTPQCVPYAGQQPLCYWSKNRMSLWEYYDGSWRFLPTAIDPVTLTVSGTVYAPGRVALIMNTSQFSDVSYGFWAKPYIDRLLAADVVNGFPDVTFQPDGQLTHAQFIKMLVLTLGLPLSSGSTPFSDVPANAWYTPYVGAAVQAGLTTNLFTTSFSPNSVTTREQMAVLLARGLHLSGSSQVIFSDASQIDSWALPSVQAAVAAGYLDGFPDGTFRPLAPLTRAQAAKVMALAIQAMAPK